MIPKKIHYCWFGGNKPKKVLKYMCSWEKTGYEIKEWNEKNCDFERNEYIRKAKQNNQYAYLSDYFRVLALYNEGGIYFDTDVEVKESFDNLLEYKGFVGFIFDSSIGTAVFGFQKKHPFLKEVLKIYDTAVWNEEDQTMLLTFPSGNQMEAKVNNDLFTGLMLEMYPEFLLNGKRQSLKEMEVFPKEEFELGYITKGKGYSVHKCEGAWRNMTLKKKINAIVKSMVSYLPFLNWDILIRTVTYHKYKTEAPFYERYLKDITK